MRALLLVGLLVFSSSAWAWRLSTEVEFIGGYEMAQKTTRTNHTLLRLIWGARVALGTFPLALEVEFLRGTDEEVFTGPSLTVRDTDLMGKVGLRSRVQIGRDVRLFFRAGGQATKNSHYETDGSTVTNSLPPLAYHPYLGFGVNVEILRNLLHWKLGLTSVFVNFPSSFTLNNYQLITSVSIRFP